jgi:uncharacterized protein (DUF1330 family)
MGFSGMAKIYLVGEFQVTNPAGFAPYRAAINEVVSRFGGRFLVRTGSAGAKKLIEGEPEPKTIVIIEVPHQAAFDRWWKSPEYQKILPIRLENCTGRIYTVEGLEP